MLELHLTTFSIMSTLTPQKFKNELAHINIKVIPNRSGTSGREVKRVGKRVAVPASINLR
jgi:hypothetical protein